MRRDSDGLWRGRLAAAAGLGMLLVHASCGLDHVDVPPLTGPAETGVSIQLAANPDVLTADGFSTSLIVATVRGPNGEPLTGRAILFAIQSGAGGGFADIGTLYDTSQSTRLRAAEATIATNASGVAQAVYQAPARTDATADQSVLVAARPLGTDFSNTLYHTVRIELKSAEPKLFPGPPVAGNNPPVCNFVVEAPIGDATCTGAGKDSTCTIKIGAQVLFQDASSDPDTPTGDRIVRYEWFFGDGTGVNYDIDQNHVFRSAGSFTVTHRVTDSFGAAAACSATINVQ